ncbi:ABC transporter permease [Paenibacillus sp. GCM10023248]|uniref:ABC transporter permease n=1 Tax=Bacillales TaxID=1385 RepID=UPI00237979AD|nr:MULTISPECIES: ABC transporter permease subunit [Bacillales]MDD9269575.1 ABC transporter permease subunit [Paenibacillus sp. MAHUQ-63]MDR6880794.1 putative aldouronate transport system permease protein [Bacillus sp. 3255]
MNFHNTAVGKTMRKRIAENKYLYIMMFLPVVYFILFKYVPMLGIVIAFQDYNFVKGIFHSEWVGFANFREFLTDSYFWKLVRNTVVINLYMLIFAFPAPIILALVINEIKFLRFKKLVQTISYLPHFLSTVIVCGMVVNLMSNGGLINQLLGSFGKEPIPFLMDASWFRSIYVSSEIWQGIGWGSIIYLAALTSVDPQQYEAAKMDGANRWQQIWNITIPGIIPVVTIMFLLSLGNIMTIGFEKILLLYTGPTYETADVISTYVYRRGLLSSDFSYGTAVELFQSVIALVFITSANKISRKVGETSLW